MKMQLKNLFSDKNIEILSLVYIIIPYIIFAFGWLKLPVALILAVLIVVSAFLYIKKLDNKEIYFLSPTPYPLPQGRRTIDGEGAKPPHLDTPKFYQFTNKYFLITILILLVWCLLSGMGGFGFQNNPDWEKNNAIFHDLFLYKWPVIYKDYSLVYYLGYYLPIGLVMKLFGWNIGYLFSFLWGFSGLILAVYWLKRLSGSFSPLIILLFVFFSGLDILGLIIKFSIFPDPYTLSHFKHVGCIEWWAGFFQFSSMTTTLFWVPQYAMQGWLLTGLVLNNIQNHNSSRNLLFLWALCIFGVPLIFLAIIPIIFAGIYKTKKLKELFSFQNFIAAPFIILVFMAYFTSKAFKDPFNAMSDYMLSPYFIVIYVLFTLVEFGLYAIVIHKYFKNDVIWNVTLISMILMPFIRLGGGNEFVMRGSACYLFIFFIYIIRALWQKSLTKAEKSALAIFFLIGAFTPFLEIKRSVTHYSAEIPVLSKQYSVMELYKYRNNYQYLGDKEAFFWKYLAK